MGLNHACIRGQAMAFDITRRSALVAKQMHWWWFLRPPSAMHPPRSLFAVSLDKRLGARST